MMSKSNGSAKNILGTFIYMKDKDFTFSTVKDQSNEYYRK